MNHYKSVEFLLNFETPSPPEHT